MAPTRKMLVGIISVIALFGVTACALNNDDSSKSAGTAVAPRKITVAGDSISVGFGAALRSKVGTGVDVKVIGVEGTGLARPDNFDWPARLAQLAREFPPAVLVISVGSNDAQDLTDSARQGPSSGKRQDAMGYRILASPCCRL